MKKQILFKVVSVICILSLCFSSIINAAEKVVNTELDLPQSAANQMVDGTIVLEAETMEFSNNWMELINDLNCSGGQGLKAINRETGLGRDNIDTASPPDATLSFVSDTSEPVYMWMRLKTPGDYHDSLFYNVNGSKYRAKHFSAHLLEDTSVYYWSYITYFDTFEVGQTVDFNIQVRELYVCLDKIVFTTDMTYNPVGMNENPGDVKADYSDLYPMPPVAPVGGHPRLVFNKEDIPDILENIEHENMKQVYIETAKKADTVIDAKLDTSIGRNYNAAKTEQIVCRALFYALGLRDKSHGLETIQNIKDYLATVRFDLSRSDETRAVGAVLMSAAAVYDWCYDLLTDDDKEYIIKKMKEHARKTEVGYPPTGLYSISGHGGEGEIFAYPLACGIAIYDEDPEMYNLCAGRLFSEMRDARIEWNKSGKHPIGAAYGLTRFDWESFSNLLFRGMGYDDVFGDPENIDRVAKSFMYMKLPQGSHFKSGDDYAWAAWAPRTWWSVMDASIAFAAAQSEDPYLHQFSLINKFMSGYQTAYKTIMPDLILSKPNIEGEFMDTMPLANKTDYPLTSMQARTSWQLGINSDTAAVYMEAREKLNGPDHTHADLGSFQLYYKGMLAVDGGNYQGTGGGWGSSHYKNYLSRTIAHNCMLVFDPNEKTFGGYSNDGGQKVPEELQYYEQYEEQEDAAKTDGWYIGPNKDTPEFSSLKTNLTNAYGGEKVENHERSMVFIDLDNDDYPAAFIVFDDLTASEKNFKKTWIMNTVLEPEIAGNTAVVGRNDNGYNGKLVNKTMLPQSPSISTVGGPGKESYVNGVNYPTQDLEGMDSEQGSWRIEISPSEEKKQDFFLNAMYFTDYDRNLPELPMYMEETGNLYGVTVMDRAVYFPKQNVIKSTQSFELRDNGYETVKCLVTDVEPGLWKVTDSTGEFKVYMVNNEENTLYFRAAPGQCTISKLITGNADSIEYEKMKKSRYGQFLVYNEKTSQFMALNSPTIVRDGVRLVPVADVFAELGEQANISGNSISVELSGKMYNMSVGSTSAMFDGEYFTLSVPPVVIDDIVYIPIEDLHYLSTSYDSAARILSISVNNYDSYIADDICDYVIPFKILSGDDAQTDKSNICDGDMSTSWTSDGIGKELILELNSLYTLKNVVIKSNNETGIPAFFELEISNDGANYEKIFSGSSSSDTYTVDIPNGKDIKYVKFKGNGSIYGKQNSVSEIILIKRR